MKRLILILIGALFLAACAPAQKDSATGTNAANLTRTESQGEVTLKITPLNLENPGDTLQFEVAMDTHSVELDLDLAILATLAGCRRTKSRTRISRISLIFSRKLVKFVSKSP